MTKLEIIESLCEKDGPCWFWTGAMDDRGRPTMRFKGKTVAVRRVVRMLTDDKDIPPGMQVPCSCGHTSCVSPDCSSVATPKKRAQMAASRGAFNRPDALLKSTLTRRARSHITEDKIRRIRNAEGPSWKVAEAEGVSLSHTKNIRANRARKDYSNPFAGLGAR
jgi:hypothetical protein